VLPVQTVLTKGGEGLIVEKARHSTLKTQKYKYMKKLAKLSNSYH
jgi:hypothetical protein